MSDRISRAWVTFQEKVLPAEASPVQVRETRRAFYAGALVMVQEILRAVDDDEDTSIARLEQLRKECEAFFGEVAKGQA